MKNSKKFLRTTIIYYRDYKKETKNPYNIPFQKKLAEDFASKNGYRILETFKDENLSGRNFNRPAFKEMVDYIKANKYKIKFIIVSDNLRLSSNKNNLKEFKFFLRRNGIKVISITEIILKTKERKRRHFEF